MQYLNKIIFKICRNGDKEMAIMRAKYIHREEKDTNMKMKRSWSRAEWQKAI
jgi:hypothetical protein